MNPSARGEDPRWVRWTLTGLALAVIGLVVVIPVVNVFYEALAEGLSVYKKNLLDDADTRHAIGLTLTVVPFALVANVLFGVAAAWAVARFRFPGRTLFIALIDLPFSVSPVVAGLMFVLIFGLRGFFGQRLREDGYAWVPYFTSFVIAMLVVAIYLAQRPRDPALRRGLHRHAGLVLPALAVGVYLLALFLQLRFEVWPKGEQLRILFATPGLILATSFVTFPFVARELIPVMEAVGPEEELAAISLGASGWQMFWHVTLPNVKWGLIYGIILCNARAIGEFGAVYVVSGHIAGETDTMPLRIEKLFQEYNLPGSFAVASILTLVAIGTLVVKVIIERRVPLLRGAKR
jgi:sulfate/thiosulfate transport system permease protein